MKKRKREKREKRQSSGYADLIVQARLDSAAAGALTAQVTASVEACAGLWERAFGAARLPGFEPGMLATIGRSMMLRGEAVIVRINGQPALGSHWDIDGAAAAPSGWRYRVDVETPSGAVQVRTSGRNVCHPRIGVESIRPWAGRSPLASMPESVRLLAALEASLADELAGPVGHVLPVPDVGALGDIPNTVAALRGRTVFGETTAQGWGEGKTAAPAQDWRPQRIGPDPPNGTVLLRQQAAAHVLAACGVPVELIHHAEGGGAREAWRRFLHGTIAPVGAILAAESARAFGLSGVIDFDALFASDLAGRARAYGQLIAAGIDGALARRICGFA